MSGGAASMAAGSPERGCRRQRAGGQTAGGCGAAKLRSNRQSAAGGSGLSAGAAGSGGCLRRAGGEAAGRETAEAVRKSDSKSVDFRSEAEDGHSLARLERD